MPIVALAIVTPLAGLPLVLLPIHLVWLELIVRPVSALVFQAEPATVSTMSRPPRDPAAPLLPRNAVIRSSASGGILAFATFGTYWWQNPLIGDASARALALIVLLGGYQTLVFAERLALPESVTRVPRTRVFWIVWCASTLSVIAVLSIPAVADVFRVKLPSPVAVGVAALKGVLAVAWRLVAHPTRSIAYERPSDADAGGRQINRDDRAAIDRALDRN